MLENLRTRGRDEAAAHPAAVRAVDVDVTIGRRPILKGVSLEIHLGETVALLGPNGAGKTTLVDCLEGFRPVDGGQVRVLGAAPHRAPREWRDRIGVILQDTRLDADLTVREFAAMTAAWYADPVPVEEMLRTVGLEDRGDRRVHRLSGGERRRLDLGLALIGRPEVLFLDEPTTGLDPRARREIWSLIQGLHADGTAVLLTSHDLQEVEALAQRIVILVDGQVLMEGTPAELRASAAGTPRISFVTGDARTASLLGAVLDESTGRQVLEAPDLSATVRRLHRSLGDDVVDVRVETSSFEQMYLDVLDEAAAPRGQEEGR